MNRREFMYDLSVGAAGIATLSSLVVKNNSPRIDDINARRIPRWRGFNLQGWFGNAEKPNPGPAYDEFDFTTMAEWGFDFARLPLSYWTWGSRDDWSLINEAPLKKIDQAVELGKQYNIHININFHRIPGYCINER